MRESSNTAPFSPPPEGVVSGDSIPRENEEKDVEWSKVIELANTLKTHPGYGRKADDELLEIAKEKLQ